MMTAKENVIRTLRHDNPEWIPVNLWQLPAAKLKYGQALDDIINAAKSIFSPLRSTTPPKTRTSLPNRQLYRLLGIDLGKSPSRYYREVKEYPLPISTKFGTMKVLKKLFLSGISWICEKTKAFIGHS